MYEPRDLEHLDDDDDDALFDHVDVQLE